MHVHRIKDSVFFPSGMDNYILWKRTKRSESMHKKYVRFFKFCWVQKLELCLDIKGQTTTVNKYFFVTMHKNKNSRCLAIRILLVSFQNSNKTCTKVIFLTKKISTFGTERQRKDSKDVPVLYNQNSKCLPLKVNVMLFKSKSIYQ